MADKTVRLEDFAGVVESGMTIGIGGWGSRRKPMALVREILRGDARDLTVVTFGGPDAGLLCAAGKVRKLVYGFVSLDSIALDPHFRSARERGEIETAEYDEGMVVTGLRAAASRLSFLPTRAGLGSDVLTMNPDLKTVNSPYTGEEYVAMKALPLDLALLHMNRADPTGNAQYLGPDPYFDDLFARAADRCYVSAERVVPDLLAEGPAQTLLLSRIFVTGVIETPRGAHFTSCVPDHPRDEAFQAHYAASAKDPAAWELFRKRFLDGDERAYQQAVTDFHTEEGR
ncbi:CoA transferase subunit A [Streptomyces acidiscabies]|uniref:CoA transferase subunit A n=1 Tax=Streptomyces acidiscabies TaxID=42234 RepID=A0AAP6EI17_9ACTN|nr:CoA-transferase [Streptomyces acidiscabies]MBP5934857.1 CoA transferase subunit A [Streptomyces sp. LBUM 1476]MBZ3917386.1 CoA transferase subunit A [Streptomyces acidiscabies]MDX2963469.1 CoA transferase subunit A [Streptomyces acidiscabies]MDX3018766.1 CoA transferase subunit A [Streptomyces acidiscabies]MDX3790562.1 CoA transferase subunit A [Streptomyces acidiscabies]